MLTRHTVTDFAAAAQWAVERMRALAPGPFERPVLLAEHPAQWRALTLALAKAQGCFASTRILTPDGWVDEALQLEGAQREWRPRAMRWRLAAAIEADVARMPDSAQRIVEARDHVALHEFAQQVAQRFRDYLLYRPALLLAWERGELLYPRESGTEAWQSLLWTTLVARTGTPSPAARVAAALRGELALADDVPATIHVITDTRVPPTVAQMLECVAARREVHWCTVDWRQGAAPGRAGTLLRGVQEDLLHARTSTTAADLSLSLHACHSALREIETLQELAVQAMASDATLRPEDITLYVSDISAYAPAVEAVFDVAQEGLPTIPYSIAGRPYREASPVARTVMQVVDAAAGRASLEEIGGLLRLEPVARAAGFSDEDTATVLRLAMQAGITWGESGAARAAQYDLPALEAGTWQRGIDRLVLGVATGPSTTAVDDLLPVSGAMAGHAALIGQLAAWSKRLFETFAAMREARRPTAWVGLMERLLREFVQASSADDDNALRAVREAMRTQLEALAAAAPDAELTLETLRAMLARALDERGAKAGHLRGGLRVCRLEPGTILPARVVLMAGFDDALHPGGGGSLSWDLLLQEKQPGDPDRRTEALDAFREALCSACDAVHVAYTGFTITKHEGRAPSVAVSELLERVQRVLPEAERGTFLREAAAHPFSPQLFTRDGAGALQSAATGWAEAARQIVRGEGETPTFGAEPVPAEVPGVIALDALAACVVDPTKYFCAQVLGLKLYEDDDALADREPQGIAPFTSKGVSNDFRPVSWRVEEAVRRGEITSARGLQEWVRHQPELAYGAEGAEVSAVVAEAWWASLEVWARLTWLDVRPVELRVGPYTLVGRLDRLTPDARVIASLYDVSEATGLRQWVQHLVLNVLHARGEDVPTTTRFLGVTPWELKPVPEAETRLEDLCAFFAEARRRPQPLYRRAGIDFLVKLDLESPDAVTDQVRDAAVEKAREAWEGGGWGERAPESAEEWHQLCWSGANFITDDAALAEMQQVSARVLLPYLQASTHGRGKRS